MTDSANSSLFEPQNPVLRRLQALETFLTPQRRARLAEILAQRTRKITVVVEDIHHPHNLAALQRTCDACGIQDLHVIEVRTPYEVANRVSRGSEQWLTLHRHPGDNRERIRHCYESLKVQGYRLAATSSHTGRPIDELDVSTPVALLFGNEREGLPSATLAEVDELVTVPMYGFAESLNLSVAAAVCLFTLTNKLRRTTSDWGISPEEQAEILLDWTRNSIPNIEPIERRLFGEQKG